MIYRDVVQEQRRMKRKLPLGIQIFRRMREENRYYVDKAAFCRDIRKPDLVEEAAAAARRHRGPGRYPSPSGRAPVRFRRLLEALCDQAGQRVVVLVDEYDRPILDAMKTPETAEANRDDLRGLYATIKDADAGVPDRDAAAEAGGHPVPGRPAERRRLAVEVRRARHGAEGAAVPDPAT